MTKYVKKYCDEGVVIVCRHADGSEETVSVIEFLQILEYLQKQQGQEMQSHTLIVPAESIASAEQEDVAIYWSAWKKVIVLCAQLVDKREKNKAVGYLPKELTEAFRVLSEASQKLGFQKLDDRMTCGIEQKVCARSRDFLRHVEGYAKKSVAVSASELCAEVCVA